MQVFALKGDLDWSERTYASLQAGEGRFGWSYMIGDDGKPLGDADLRRLKSKIDTTGWNTLTKDEQDRYQSFLLDLKDKDWVIYVNVPKWGLCTLAQVTGPYYWEQKDQDFNHCFPVDPKSVREFDRNYTIVYPYLSARLKLQGRFWRIEAEEEFKALLAGLDSSDVRQIRTPYRMHIS